MISQSANLEGTMGLAEKRVQQEFEKERIPQRLAQFKEQYCPASKLAVEIDWKSLEGDKAGLDNLWSIWEQGFHGLEGVCEDDLGKQAVAENVKKLVIRNVAGAAQVGAEFKDGVVTVRMACKDGSSGTPGWTAIKEVIEAGL